MQKVSLSIVRLIQAAGLTLLCAWSWPTDSQAAPFRPGDDGLVLERLPASGDEGDSTLSDLRRALRDDPADLSLALRAARAYARLGRAEADPRYYGYAQSALAPWWQLEAPPLEVQVLRAVLRQAGHDFDAALQDLTLVLGRRPDHAQARLTQAMVLRALGRPGEAVESCEALAGRVPTLVTATCLAATGSLTGRAEQSYERLRLALAEAQGAPAQLRLWALTVLGEIARQRGDDGAAERHFRDATAVGARNSYLMGALADLLLDQGRTTEVRDLLAGEERADALLLRLTEAELRLGDARGDAHRIELAARFAAGRRRGDGAHLREEARFELRVAGRPDRALRLAKENWQDQREPADAELLLEAAAASGAEAAADPVLEWMEATSIESARLDALVALLSEGSG